MSNTKTTRKKWFIGIDEAGRGSLAGPVAVGAVCVPVDFDFAVFSVVRDSKQLSPRVRERVFHEVHAQVRRRKLRYCVVLVPASTIDTKGIVAAVQQGIDTGLEKLAVRPQTVEVRLDGLLIAPKVYRAQKTIIKGDVTEPVISLASIMAKVTRDAHMVGLSKKYEKYGLEVHKGYGTKAHRAMITKHGLSKVHRRSFCRKFQ